MLTKQMGKRKNNFLKEIQAVALHAFNPPSKGSKKKKTVDINK